MTFAARLGANVREMRTHIGLTQRRLADLAGLSSAEVGAVERGERVPRADTAFRLAGALGVNVDKLFFCIAWLPRGEGPGEFVITTLKEWHKETMKRAAEAREGTGPVDAAALIREVRDEMEEGICPENDDSPS